jgi:hypothetical protein
MPLSASATPLIPYSRYWAHNVFQNVISMKKLSLINSHRWGISPHSSAEDDDAAWHDSNSFILNCCWCISGIRAPVHICYFFRLNSHPTHSHYLPSLSSSPSSPEEMKLSSNMLYDISSSCFHINNFFLHFQYERERKKVSTHPQTSGVSI